MGDSGFEKVPSPNYFNLGDNGYQCSVTGMVYRYAKGPTERAKAIISLIVIAGLFQAGWYAIRVFMKVMQGKETDIEVILVHKSRFLIRAENCVGMGIVSRKQVQVFVHKAYRRKQIGSRILKLFKEKGSTYDHADLGIPGSRKFWNENNVRIASIEHLKVK